MRVARDAVRSISSCLSEMRRTENSSGSTTKKDRNAGRDYAIRLLALLGSWRETAAPPLLLLLLVGSSRRNRVVIRD